MMSSITEHDFQGFYIFLIYFSKYLFWNWIYTLPSKFPLTNMIIWLVFIDLWHLLSNANTKSNDVRDFLTV